ncbi:hypothetical protein FB45DRAFT_837508 [Roridomyces roridus]|uniref:ATP-dependent DNA ligase family profile domain-containing protein n=1 Tax=Roridomyces roridus TaxID=1738132 RepID=A0AAD7BKD7_9AGAR|nr:hypothetical protein FB45DRAFT_837508 [Roridomyces roridus]
MADIPFSFFVSLIREISTHTRPRRTGSRRDKQHHPALDVLKNWIAHLRSEFSPLPQETTARVFRLLFPEEDTRRKYDMQETRLAAALADCFSVQQLCDWGTDSSSICLGDHVLKVLGLSSDSIGPLSISQVDCLLEELASHSGYSHSSVRQKHPPGTRRPRSAIIRSLYRSLPPFDAAVLTQIILKDLRPLLYPLSEIHFTAALRSFTSEAVTQLTKEDAMRVWDPSRRMLDSYRIRSGLDDASFVFDSGIDATPQIGTPVDIPKSQKGQGCLHALAMLQTSRAVWAETKYDGERTQIHVEILPDGSSNITIFSKSKRDSTMDRHGIHGLIRRALGLSERPELRRVKANVILDAEMVAWHDGAIDEFWRIRSLVEHTAVGVRHKKAPDPVDNYSQISLMTDVSGDRHLGLVFFDILFLDSASLLSTSYSSRRVILESVITPIPGHAILAERQPIALNSIGRMSSLQHVFADCISRPEEGLVLKAGEAGYNDKRSPWVKLKKDYIPGYGDCVDLVILGVAWEKDRARELRVAPNTYTTFYIGGLHNADQLQRDPSARPHFRIYFTAAYGLSREQLEEANFLIQNSDTVQYKASNPSGLPYTCQILPGLVPPSQLLREPLLAELYGAGFTKSARSRHYELRFPRITKIFRTCDRSWRDAVNLQALHKIARESVGKDSSTKQVEEWGNKLWGKSVSSPGADSKRKALVDEWEEKLITADRKYARRRDMILSQPQPLGSRTNLEEPASPLALDAPSAVIRPQDSACEFLPGSLVFVATRNPILRAQCKSKVPPERLVDSLESLFTGCGWASGQTSNPHVQRGVIVLDSAEEPFHRKRVLNTINDRQWLGRELSGRKAIQVLERHT